MRTITQALAQTALAALFLASVSHAVTKHEPVLDEHGLEKTDCQIRCPPSSPEKKRVVLPALAQVKNNATGEWENVVECWAVSSNVVSNSVSDIDNVFRLNWEGGFDAAYQYIFTGDSFMPAHPAPEPSLIIMSAGAGKFYQHCY